MMHGLNLINMAEPDKNWEANARLIVAAPEMLLALKEAFESLAAEDGCNIAPIIGSDNPHEHATGLVQAAISKAEAQP